MSVGGDHTLPCCQEKNAQCEGVIFSFNMAMDQKPGILVNINIVGTSRQMFMPKYGIG